MNRRLIILAVVTLLGVAAYIGYRQVPPRPVAKQLNVLSLDNKLTIKFVPRGECGAGEVEAILAALPRESPLLLTIEPLDSGGNGFAPVAKRIEPLLLKQVGEHTLTVPARRGETNAGIFVCSDLKKTGRCSDKNTVGFEELQRASFVTADVQHYEDQIFYFQYVFASRNGLQFLRPTATEDKARDAVRAALQTANTPPNKRKELEQRIMNWLVKVGSTTLTPAAGEKNPTLVINLGQMDESVCPARPKTVKRIPRGSSKRAGN